MLAEVIVDYLRSTAYYQLRAADDAGAASFDEVDPAIWAPHATTLFEPHSTFVHAKDAFPRGWPA